MSTRLQVVMSEAELDEIRAAAERRRMTVSAWVRLALREEREVMRRGPAVIREAGVSYGEASDGPSRRVPIEVDVKEDLLEAVRERHHLTSHRAAIEFALRRVAVSPMSKEEAQGMEGSVGRETWRRCAPHPSPFRSVLSGPAALYEPPGIATRSFQLGQVQRNLSA
jgi:Arc/MetJ family transcription regulator